MIRFKPFLSSDKYHKLNQEISDLVEELIKLDHLKTLGKDSPAEKAMAKERIRKVFNELIESL